MNLDERIDFNYYQYLCSASLRQYLADGHISNTSDAYEAYRISANGTLQCFNWRNITASDQRTIPLWFGKLPEKATDQKLETKVLWLAILPGEIEERTRITMIKTKKMKSNFLSSLITNHFTEAIYKKINLMNWKITPNPFRIKSKWNSKI